MKRYERGQYAHTCVLVKKKPEIAQQPTNTLLFGQKRKTSYSVFPNTPPKSKREQAKQRTTTTTKCTTHTHTHKGSSQVHIYIYINQRTFLFVNVIHCFK